VQGKEISLSEAPVASTGGNVIDLMAALRMSIDAKGTKALSKQRKGPKRAAEVAPRKTARR
jgi:non-homologous end joining protein Ku